MTEKPTRTPYFCPLTKERCRIDCAWQKEGQCAIHIIGYEIGLLKGY